MPKLIVGETTVPATFFTLAKASHFYDPVIPTRTISTTKGTYN